MISNEITKLTLGISIKLPIKTEQQTVILGLESAPEGDSESLKISDGSRPLARTAAYWRRSILSALRRSAIKVVKRRKWWSASWGPGEASGWYCTPKTG